MLTMPRLSPAKLFKEHEQEEGSFYPQEAFCGTKEEKSTCEKWRKAREYYSFLKSALRKPSTETDLQ